MEQPWEAWVIGLGYHFETMGIEGLNTGIAYGSFQADNASMYDIREIDAIVEYTVNESFYVTVAYADIDSKIDTITDYSQVRMIANYNF